MTYKPLRDLIVIKLDPVPELSASSLIVIPVSAQTKPTTGEVVATGPGVRNKAGELVPVAVTVGERVMIGQGSGREIDVDGEQLIVISEDDIMVVFN